MDWASLVRDLQLVTCLTWIGYLFNNTAAVLRWWKGERRPGDAALAGVAMFAITQVGFSIRWLVFGKSVASMSNPELISWCVLYAMSVISSIVVVWSVQVETGEGRHKTALFVQMGISAIALLIAVLQ